MHISEGVLSGAALITGWAVSAAGVAVGLKKTEPEKLVRVALLSSAFFLASLVNIRIGAASTHLTLIAPSGIILGWSIFPGVFVALLLQALLFQFGGLIVLGVNVCDMALPGLVVYLIFGNMIRNSGSKIFTSTISFIAGALAVLMGALMLSIFLYTTDENFLSTAKIIMLAHIPLALIEGLINMFLILWLKKTAPEFLKK